MLKSIYLFLILTNVVLQLYAALPTITPTAIENNVAAVTADATIVASAASNIKTNTANTNNCQSNSLDQSLYCRGSRAIRNVINNLNKSDKPIVIVRGLEIVRSRKNASEASGDYPPSNAIDVDDTFVGRFSEYLRTHELNIKFSDLLADESERFSARDLERNGLEIGNSIDNLAVEEARKKDKGQGILMAMALMFGKMMAVMGLGGIGALALKALGVAMAALMMAGIVGLKSLSQHGGGGHEASHSVQYLAADGHHHRRRRRRSLELMKQLYNENNKKQTHEAYRGWMRGGNASK